MSSAAECVFCNVPKKVATKRKRGGGQGKQVKIVGWGCSGCTMGGYKYQYDLKIKYQKLIDEVKDERIKWEARIAKADEQLAKANRLQRCFEKEVMDPRSRMPMFKLPDGSVIAKVSEKDQYLAGLEEEVKTKGVKIRLKTIAQKEMERRLDLETAKHRLTDGEAHKLRKSLLNMKAVSSKAVESVFHLENELVMVQAGREQDKTDHVAAFAQELKLGEEFRKTTARLLDYKDCCNISIQADLTKAKLDRRNAVKTMYNIQRSSAEKKALSEEQRRALRMTKEENTLFSYEQEALKERLLIVEKNLELTKGALEDALGKMKSMTPWVDKLGKKGEQYDVFVAETGLQLMGLGLTAPQAVYSLAIFLKRTFPYLEAGKDYRIPGAWFFKRVAEILYPIGKYIAKTLMDKARIIYLGCDGSPRDGWDLFGQVASLVMPADVFGDSDDEDGQMEIVHSIDLLPNKLHQTQADCMRATVGDAATLKVSNSFVCIFVFVSVFPIIVFVPCHHTNENRFPLFLWTMLLLMLPRSFSN